MTDDLAPAGRFVPLPAPIIDAAEFARLNDAYYLTKPHEYFDGRLALLTLIAAKPDLLREEFERGLEYDGMKVGGAEIQRDTPEEEEQQHTAWLISESVMLKHQISETLLRFYFAHRPNGEGRVSPCPWYAISRELSHVAFKRSVEKRFDDTPLTEPRRDELATVFYPKPLLSPDAETMARLPGSIENIEKWLQNAAAWFLGDSNLFNALKHGLAVRPGPSEMELITAHDKERGAEDKPLISADGPAVEFLERFGDENQWHRSVRWVVPRNLMLETTFMLRLLRQIWQVGRLRYTKHDHDQTSVDLSFYDQPPYDEIVRLMTTTGDADESGGRILMTSMRVSLQYVYRYNPKLLCAGCGRERREGETDAAERWRGLDDGSTSLLAVYCAECVERMAAPTDPGP